MQSYENIDFLQAVYLEDSYVTSIKADEMTLEFEVELVLKPEHACFRTPIGNEEYCYKSATLKFENATSIRWKRIIMKASIDKELSIDFGNIDSFTFDDDTFYLEGDWGEVEVSGGQVALIIH